MENLSILQALQDLQTSVYELTKFVRGGVKPKYDWRSEDIGDFSKALAKAQSEMTPAPANARSQQFNKNGRYADIEDTFMAGLPPLTKYGICVTQPIITDRESGTMYLKTVLTHETTGQYICSEMRLVPPSQEAQKLGAYITYMRRYAFGALAGVVKGEPDDDARQITEEMEGKEKISPGNKYLRNESGPALINAHQLNDLEIELEGYPDLCSELLTKMNISCLADLPERDFLRVRERIRIKKIEEGTKKH